MKSDTRGKLDENHDPDLIQDLQTSVSGEHPFLLRDPLLKQICDRTGKTKDQVMRLLINEWVEDQESYLKGCDWIQGAYGRILRPQVDASQQSSLEITRQVGSEWPPQYGAGDIRTPAWSLAEQLLEGLQIDFSNLPNSARPVVGPPSSSPSDIEMRDSDPANTVESAEASTSSNVPGIQNLDPRLLLPSVVSSSPSLSRPPSQSLSVRSLIILFDSAN